jgi:hypothetical protein
MSTTLAQPSSRYSASYSPPNALSHVRSSYGSATVPRRCSSSPSTRSSVCSTSTSIDDVEEYVERGLLRLNKEINDEVAVQQIVFTLITRARLTAEVMKQLRGTYLRILISDLSEKFLPTSFSKMTWKFVSKRFTNLKPPYPDGHERIPNFPLQRARLPMLHYEHLLQDLDKGILRVGPRISLENEAAVHEYATV